MADRFLSRVTDSKSGELFIYDMIGAGLFGGISSKEIASALGGMKQVKTLDVYINSPGGDVFEAIAIHNLLDRFQAKKRVHVDALAASAASFLAMVGDEIITASNAFWMIHDPWTMAMGSASDMRKAADTLDKVKESIVGFYANRTKADTDQIRAWMADETWMNAAEAKERGFTDLIAEHEATQEQFAAASSSAVIANFKHVPQAFQSASRRRSAMRLADAEAFAISLSRSNPPVSGQPVAGTRPAANRPHHEEIRDGTSQGSRTDHRGTAA